MSAPEFGNSSLLEREHNDGQAKGIRTQIDCVLICPPLILYNIKMKYTMNNIISFVYFKSYISDSKIAKILKFRPKVQIKFIYICGKVFKR